jgi:hypothetical protein
MRLKYAALAIIASLAVMASCGGDDDDNGSNGSSTEPGPDFLLTDVEDLVLMQIDRINAGLDEGDPATLDDEQLRDVLATMVLQVEDVPEGLEPLGGSYSTNEESASGIGAGPSKEQLDEWGRILGYRTDYQRVTPAGGPNTTAISTSISMYQDADGATLSFDDRVELARGADWQESHNELEEFEQREVAADLPADDLYWLRLSGYQVMGNNRTFVTDDQIIFRIGQAWGFIGAVSTGPAD